MEMMWNAVWANLEYMTIYSSLITLKIELCDPIKYNDTVSVFRVIVEI